MIQDRQKLETSWMWGQGDGGMENNSGASYLRQQT